MGLMYILRVVRSEDYKKFRLSHSVWCSVVVAADVVVVMLLVFLYQIVVEVSEYGKQLLVRCLYLPIL